MPRGESERLWPKTLGVLALLLALSAIGIGSLFVAPFSDLRLALYDPVRLGFSADPSHPLSIHPSHPLSSWLARGVALLAEALGVEQPGTFAVRFLSVFGALICALALTVSRRQFATAVFVALPILLSRGFLVEAYSGEVLPLSCAVLALAYRAAAAIRLRPVLLGLLVILGASLRQDFILHLPALLLLAFRPLNTAGSLRRLALFLVLTGAATLLVYLVSHRLMESEAPFFEWLLSTALDSGSWAEARWPALRDFATQLATGGSALIGFWFLDPIGPAFLFHGVIAVGAIAFFTCLPFLSREAPSQRARLALMGLLSVTLPFYAWFEPENFEWWLPIFVGLLALSRSVLTATAFSQQTNARLVRIGALFSFFVFCAHAPSTFRLLDTKLLRTVEAAGQLCSKEGPTIRIFSSSPRLLLLAQKRWKGAETQLILGSPMEWFERLGAEIARHPVSTLVLFDREIEDGSPGFWLRTIPDPWTQVLDGLNDPAPQATERLLRDANGRVIALGFLFPSGPPPARQLDR